MTSTRSAAKRVEEEQAHALSSSSAQAENQLADAGHTAPDRPESFSSDGLAGELASSSSRQYVPAAADAAAAAARSSLPKPLPLPPGMTIANLRQNLRPASQRNTVLLAAKAIDANQATLDSGRKCIGDRNKKPRSTWRQTQGGLVEVVSEDEVRASDTSPVVGYHVPPPGDAELAILDNPETMVVAACLVNSSDAHGPQPSRAPITCPENIDESDGQAPRPQLFRASAAGPLADVQNLSPQANGQTIVLESLALSTASAISTLPAIEGDVQHPEPQLSGRPAASTRPFVDGDVQDPGSQALIRPATSQLAAECDVQDPGPPPMRGPNTLTECAVENDAQQPGSQTSSGSGLAVLGTCLARQVRADTDDSQTWRSPTDCDEDAGAPQPVPADDAEEPSLPCEVVEPEARLKTASVLQLSPTAMVEDCATQVDIDQKLASVLRTLLPDMESLAVECDELFYSTKGDAEVSRITPDEAYEVTQSLIDRFGSRNEDFLERIGLIYTSVEEAFKTSSGTSNDSGMGVVEFRGYIAAVLTQILRELESRQPDSGASESDRGEFLEGISYEDTPLKTLQTILIKFGVATADIAKAFVGLHPEERPDLNIHSDPPVDTDASGTAPPRGLHGDDDGQASEVATEVATDSKWRWDVPEKASEGSDH